jgi:hypothetical protein
MRKDEKEGEEFPTIHTCKMEVLDGKNLKGRCKCYTKAQVIEARIDQVDCRKPK